MMHTEPHINLSFIKTALQKKGCKQSFIDSFCHSIFTSSTIIRHNHPSRDHLPHYRSDLILAKLNNTTKSTVSLYNLLIIENLSLESHPNLSKWHNLGPETLQLTKATTSMILKACSWLTKTPLTYLHFKYQHELILSAFRTERHLRHMPSHPTGTCRPCNICNSPDHILHTFIKCPLAQITWLRIKLTIQEVTHTCYNLDPTQIFFGLPKKPLLPLKQAKWVTSLIASANYVLAHIYYKRTYPFPISYLSEQLLKAYHEVKTFHHSNPSLNFSNTAAQIIAGTHPSSNDQTYELYMKRWAHLTSNGFNPNLNPASWNYSLILYNHAGHPYPPDTTAITSFCNSPDFDHNIIIGPKETLNLSPFQMNNSPPPSFNPAHVLVSIQRYLAQHPNPNLSSDLLWINNHRNTREKRTCTLLNLNPAYQPPTSTQ